MNRDSNIIFGRNSIKEALKANRILKVFAQNGFSDKNLISLLESQGLKINWVSINELNSCCNGVHQGIMAEIKPYEYFDFDSLITFSKKKKDRTPIIVVLDGINDPQNLGAILRSCDVFDVTGIVISKHNQVPLNATVAKTSAGAINYVPVSLVSNLNQAINRLKENSFWVVSTDGSGNVDYSSIKYDFPVCLIIGSEGFGVSKLLLDNSDYIVKIPQFGHVNSLNASVAAGILLSKIRS